MEPAPPARPAPEAKPAAEPPARLAPAAPAAPSPPPKVPPAAPVASKPAAAVLPDTVAPAITVESPSGTGRFGAALVVRGRVSDSGAGSAPGSVRSLFYQVVGSAELLGDVQFDGGGRFAIEIPAAGLAGAQKVTLVAFDAAGNSSQRTLLFEPEEVAPARSAAAPKAEVAVRTAAAVPPPAPTAPAEAAQEAPPPASRPRGDGPLVSLQEPEGGVFYGARLTLEGAVADSAEAGESAADIARLRYEISGEPPLAGDIAYDVWGGFLLNLDTGRLTGTRTLGVLARDNYGRTAERRLTIHDGRLPPRLSLRFPGQDSQYGARLLVSGRVEDPYAGLRPAGGIESVTLEILSAEYRADSRPTRLRLNPGPEGAFETVLLTGEWAGPQSLTVSARGWNKTQADLSVRLLPGGSDIPSFAVVSGDGQAMLSWEPVPLASAYSVFYREGSGGEAGAAGWQRVDRAQSPCNLRGLVNGRLYSFRLLALSSEAPELSSADVPGIPLAPQTLQPTVTGEYQQIRLAWRQIPGASAYEIWRKDGEGGAFRLQSDSTESVYVDRDVRYGTTYHYRIRPDGVGSLSAPGSGRTAALPVRKAELAATIPLATARGIALGWSYAWVAAGGDGLRIYDIHDPASPQLVATLATHDARAVAIQADRVYIADGEHGLQIADASEPLRPALLGSRTTEEACDVVVRGNYAYVADGARGLRVIDVSDPRRPERVASYDCPDARAVAAAGQRVLVADRRAGLFILDVSLPEKPVLLGSLATEQAQDLAVEGDLAFVADGPKGLKIIDVENPAAPRLLGSYDTTDARGIAVRGHYAFLADGQGGLRILDVSDPRRPVQFEMEEVRGAAAVAVQEDHVFLAHQAGLSVLRVLLTGSSFEIGSVDVGGKAFALSVSGDLAFVAGHEAGVAVVDISDTAALDGRKPLARWRGGYIEAIAATGGLVLAADQGQGLVVLRAPRVGGSSAWEPLAVVQLAGRATGIAANGRYGYVTVDGLGLEIFDLEDSRSPRLVGSFAAPSLRDVCVRGKLAYVAGDRWGLGIVDLSEPTLPVLKSRLEGCAARKVVVQGERLYAVTAGGVVGFDVSGPGAPRELFFYDTPQAEDLEVRDSYLYVAEGYRGLKVIDCGSPGGPRAVSACDGLYAVDVAVRGEYALIVDSVSLKAVQVLVPEWLR